MGQSSRISIVTKRCENNSDHTQVTCSKQHVALKDEHVSGECEIGFNHGPLAKLTLVGKSAKAAPSPCGVLLRPRRQKS